MNVTPEQQSALESLAETSAAFQQAIAEIEREQEEYWNSLSKQKQLMAFCAVVRRIHKAELEDKGTYRHALYNVFEFGPESYVPAQCAGYMALHNSIFDYDHESLLLRAFCKKYGIDDAENKVTEFLI